MSSPRVFVVQRVRRVSHSTGELEDKHDLAPAQKFGEIVYLLDSLSGRPTKASFEHDVAKLVEYIEFYKPTSSDALLPMGAPTLIGVATTLFTNFLGGRLRLLHWDHRKSDYVLLSSCIYCSDLRCTGHNGREEE